MAWNACHCVGDSHCFCRSCLRASLCPSCHCSRDACRSNRPQACLSLYGLPKAAASSLACWQMRTALTVRPDVAQYLWLQICYQHQQIASGDSANPDPADFTCLLLPIFHTGIPVMLSHLLANEVTSNCKATCLIKESEYLAACLRQQQMDPVSQASLSGAWMHCTCMRYVRGA